MKNIGKASLAAAVILAGLSSPSQAKTYEIDPAHSAVSFRVGHLMIGKVTGRFGKFSGSVDYEKDRPKTWSAAASIDSASIDTSLPDRDKHLRSADFLDVEKFPSIEFKTVRVESKGGKTKLIGDLTLHGVTKRLALDLDVAGLAKDPWGGERLGATGTTKISRKDFGLTWNKALESGGVLVGDELQITLEIEGVAKKS